MCKDVATMMIMIMIMQNMDQYYGGVQGTISIETEGSIKFRLGFRQFGSVRWMRNERSWIWLSTTQGRYFLIRRNYEPQQVVENGNWVRVFCSFKWLLPNSTITLQSRDIHAIVR